MSKYNKINIALIGATGYTGLDLTLILSKHPQVNIKYLCATKNIGKNISFFDKRIKKKLPNITPVTSIQWDNIDLIFLSLPNGEAQKYIKKKFLKNKNIKFIDLSADFRINDPKVYQQNYKISHKAKDLIKHSLYSIPELNKREFKNKRIISNPGCYPTSILIPLIPLIKEKKLRIKDIIIDSKSGISGAGKQPRIENLFSEISGNFFSYGIESHKHYPEIDQEIRLINKKVSFTFVPHVLPIISGIQSTIYLEKEFDEKEYYKTIKNFYVDEPFIKIYSGNKIPQVKEVQNTNNLAINLFSDYSKRKIVIVSCIDNLVKGAAGQAIQNMNIMFDFEETESLI